MALNEDKIYRPGEDVSHLADLSEEEKSDLRREIEEIFAGEKELNGE